MEALVFTKTNPLFLWKVGESIEIDKRGYVKVAIRTGYASISTVLMRAYFLKNNGYGEINVKIDPRRVDYLFDKVKEYEHKSES